MITEQDPFRGHPLRLEVAGAGRAVGQADLTSQQEGPLWGGGFFRIITSSGLKTCKRHQ